MKSFNMKVGVLSLQGAVSEHVDITTNAFAAAGVKGEVINVKNPSQLDEVDGLIIPGGESTTIGRISEEKRLISKIAEAARDGLSIMGTCAGAILLAKEVYDAKVGGTSQPILNLMDIKVRRNAFGKQRESFEVDMNLPWLSKQPFRTIFIRAPIIERVWGDVEVLVKYENRIVAVQQGGLIATCFHPELSNQTVMHEYFIRKIHNRLAV